MASAKKTGTGERKGMIVSKQTVGAKPDWANGLRQLYDSVVDEPLPDAFKDLLAELDRKN
jgi:hypothetical protein